MGQFGMGQPVRRKEDTRLLSGKGTFTDDINLPGQTHAYFLRSPHAHARIESIETEAAGAAPGVVAVFTGADLARDGVGIIPNQTTITDRQGNSMFSPARRALPTGFTRFVGEPLAVVVARTLKQAKDAAELIEIDFEELPAMIGTARALDANAPLVWPENGSNLVIHWDNRDPGPVEEALRAAPRRVAVDIVNNRVIPSPMEPRAALAAYDPQTDVTTLYCPSQGVSRIRNALAKGAFDLEIDKMRVVSADTGGGFGARSKLHPEMVVVVYAARKLGVPVKWLGDRSETFVVDYHGRDQVNHAEMGLDEDGRVVALKVETLANVGAFTTESGARMAMLGGGRIIPGVYDIQNFHFSVKPVFTNQVPTDSYRGAGRPEANFLMERLMDAAAEACALSRDEIRRRNMIPKSSLPYRTALGLLLDSGDFAGTMDIAMDAADWRGFADRRALSEARGRLRGIGLAYFIEGAGGFPVEEMRVRINRDGSATVFAGTYSHGQGHETVYAQLVNEYLGIDPDRVDLVQGDSATVPKGSQGTFGSRSSMMGGVAIRRACERLVAKGKAIAGHLLQSDPELVRFEDGYFRVEASSISLKEVADAAQSPNSLPKDMQPGLDESYRYERSETDFLNFPNGCHICEVEVDAELCTIEVLSYTAVDDCGTVLNPMIVHGQLYGGVAQGLGQALTEGVIYDDSGQLITSTYMDYAMPRAKHMPRVNALFNSVPSPFNDLGVKGAGEAGVCGAPSALVSAVVDALRPYGIRHVDMPLTPERLWRAMRSAAPRVAEAT